MRIWADVEHKGVSRRGMPDEESFGKGSADSSADGFVDVSVDPSVDGHSSHSRATATCLALPRAAVGYEPAWHPEHTAKL